MAIVINEKQTEFYKQAGFEYASGMVEAFDHDHQRKGVVNMETQEFFPTVPLNGWRSRNLAEEVFGIRKANELWVGRTFMVPAKVLQELPDFDSGNQAIVNEFTGVVAVQVAKVDPSYGVHIRMMQM
jgi:hypothetical protein